MGDVSGLWQIAGTDPAGHQRQPSKWRPFSMDYGNILGDQRAPSGFSAAHTYGFGVFRRTRKNTLPHAAALRARRFARFDIFPARFGRGASAGGGPRGAARIRTTPAGAERVGRGV